MTFERSADNHVKNVTVAIDGYSLKLRDKVHSLCEKDVARRSAYNALGVNEV